MRNIKKLLALMLVMVMALGMVPMVATASDNGFTDADDIEFVEAADILEELEIIRGYTDGSFQPKQTVTRAEAMAFIVRSLLTPAVANRLPSGTSSFTDVLSNPSAAWASGVIEYAVSQGIALGRGEGIFDPQAPVTGIEMAAFWLRALGIGAYNDPATWAISAVADGTKLDILTIGDDVDLSAPATREQVALYTFNSLFAGTKEVEVTPARYMIVTTNDELDLHNVDILDGVVFDTYAAAISAALSVTGSVYNPELDTKGQFMVRTVAKVTRTEGGLADDMFNLQKRDADDVFYRPVVEYLRNNRVMYTAAVPVLERYTSRVSEATLYNALGLTGSGFLAADERVTLARNGDGLEPQPLRRGESTAFIGSERTIGNGVITEVYAIGENYRIVQINVYVGEVSDVLAATATLGRRIQVTAHTGEATGDFETANFAKDDIFLYTFADEEIQDIWPAAFVSGVTVTSTSGAVALTAHDSNNNGSFVAGGTTYRFNRFSKSNADLVTHPDRAHDLWLDDNDYVVLARVSQAATPNYLFTLDGGPFGMMHQALVVFADGTIETITVSHVGGVAGESTTDESIYTYTMTNNVYKLTLATNQNTASGGTLTLTAGEPSLAGATAAHFANDRTTFVIGNHDGTRFTPYTGYRDVQGIDEAESWAYVRAGGGNAITIAFMFNGTLTAAAGRSVVIVKDGVGTGTDSFGPFREYRAIIDGEITTVKYDVENTGGELFSDGVIYKAGSVNLDDGGRVIRQVEGFAEVRSKPNNVYQVVTTHSDGVIRLDNGTDGVLPFNLDANDITVFRMRKHPDSIIEGTLANVREGDLVMIDQVSGNNPRITTIYVFAQDRFTVTASPTSITYNGATYSVTLSHTAAAAGIEVTATIAITSGTVTANTSLTLSTGDGVVWVGGSPADFVDGNTSAAPAKTIKFTVDRNATVTLVASNTL